MKDILNQLFEHRKLTKAQSKKILIEISEGKYNNAQVAVFIGVFMMRTVSVDELRGFKEALLELCIPVDLEGIESTDLCGTGGDGKNTFNISTTSSFVVAGAGYKVSKHGNYGVSSLCGSSNVLEHLGYQFSNNVDKLKKQLDASNICFFHAPLFHPAMKFVAPIRRALGVKTFFNMLGPLVNPARPTHQAVGVFSLELARLYQYLFEDESIKYAVIHALDGYDELSMTGDALVIKKDTEKILAPAHFNLPQYDPSDLFGGQSIQEAANILVLILDNNSTEAQKNVVIANTAVAINNFESNKTLEECCAIAKESIESGAAKKSFEKLIELS